MPKTNYFIIWDVIAYGGLLDCQSPASTHFLIQFQKSLLENYCLENSHIKPLSFNTAHTLQQMSKTIWGSQWSRTIAMFLSKSTGSRIININRQRNYYGFAHWLVFSGPCINLGSNWPQNRRCEFWHPVSKLVTMCVSLLFCKNESKNALSFFYWKDLLLDQ